MPKRIFLSTLCVLMLSATTASGGEAGKEVQTMSIPSTDRLLGLPHPLQVRDVTTLFGMYGRSPCPCVAYAVEGQANLRVDMWLREGSEQTQADDLYINFIAVVDESIDANYGEENYEIIWPSYFKGMNIDDAMAIFYPGYLK